MGKHKYYIQCGVYDGFRACDSSKVIVCNNIREANKQFAMSLKTLEKGNEYVTIKRLEYETTCIPEVIKVRFKNKLFSKGFEIG